MSDDIERRSFGKRILGALAALVAVPFVKPEKKSLTAAELKRIAEQNPPPPEWYDGQEENPFGRTDGEIISWTIGYPGYKTEFWENGKLVRVIELRDRGVGTF